MKKVLSIVSVLSLLAFATPALAASVSNIKFDNNQTQISCTPGQSVNVTFRVTVPTGEVAELGQVDVLGDNLAPALPTTLGDDLGLQEGAHDVTANVICPQNTGYYTVEYRTAGIYGGQRSATISDGVVSVGSFSNALRVVGTDSNTTTSNGGSVPAWQSAIDALTAQIAALAKLVTPGSGSTTPAPVSAVCTAYAQANAGTQMNVVSSANVRLQGFLLSQGASIPALAAGAAFGFYGPQTQAAVGWFQASNHCN